MVTYYLIEEWRVKKLEELEKRLYSEQRMDGNTMRDWGNWLNTNLRIVKENPITDEDLKKF